MRFLFFLFLLLSLTSISIGHPVGDLPLRHRRSDDEVLKQPGTSKDTGGECYFSKKRTSFEKVPRPEHSKVSERCEGTLKSMAELFDVKFANLYQCPNYPALILSRGAGEFDINWADKEQMKAIGSRMICPHHEAELGWNWDSKKFSWHYPRKERQHKTPAVYDPECAMRLFNIQHNVPEVLHTEIHYIEADESRAILKKHGILIAPGMQKKGKDGAAMVLFIVVLIILHPTRPVEPGSM